MATIAEDMKRLTEDMLAANDMRLKAVDALRTGTRDALKRFRSDRNKMATNQAKDFAGFSRELSKDVHEIRRKAQDMIKEFNKAGRQMSREQSDRLAHFAQGLAHDVTAMLNRFEKERGHMSKELGRQLAQEIADIKAAAEQVLKDTESFIREQHSGMVRARQAWQHMAAAIAQARITSLSYPTEETGTEGCRTKHASRKTRNKRGSPAGPN